MKKFAFLIVGTLLLSGCATTKYENVSESLRKAITEEDGKVVSMSMQVLHTDTNRWFDAEKVDGKWVLSSKGKKQLADFLKPPGGC